MVRVGKEVELVSSFRLIPCWGAWGFQELPSGCGVKGREWEPPIGAFWVQLLPGNCEASGGSATKWLPITSAADREPE